MLTSNASPHDLLPIGGLEADRMTPTRVNHSIGLIVACRRGSLPLLTNNQASRGAIDRIMTVGRENSERTTPCYVSTLWRDPLKERTGSYSISRKYRTPPEIDSWTKIGGGNCVSYQGAWSCGFASGSSAGLPIVASPLVNPQSSVPG